MHPKRFDVRNPFAHTGDAFQQGVDMNMIELVNDDALEADLCENITDRRMPDFFLYTGDEGAKNWLRLDRAREFPVARRLTVLLENSMPALLPFLPRAPTLVSIGVGSGEKERIVLEELVAACSPVYYPVDVNARMVQVALDAVRHLSIEKTGIVGRLSDLDRVVHNWRPPVVLCLLGNTFSNFEPDDILSWVSRSIGADGLFMFDCSLLGPGGVTESARERIERTYRSRRNVRFNLNPLIRRGLRPGDVRFDLKLVPAMTSAGMVYRTSKNIYVCKNCAVQFREKSVSLQAGEVIRLGFTYKYTAEQVDTLVKRAGLTVLALHRSDDDENILLLARKSTQEDS